MLSKTQIITQIETNFPQFKVWQLSKLGEGWDHQAYQVNNDYVFRFPKSKEVSKNLAKEICILPKIQNRINLTIPNFELIGFDSNTETLFVGYKQIKGTFLTKQVFDDLPAEIQEKSLSEIALFFGDLHTVAIEEIEDCNLEIIDFYQDYQQDYRILNDSIFEQITLEEKEVIERIFCDYLDNSENFNYIPCLLHNDLSSDHIIFDTYSNRVNGIIDFGDLAIGDPDYDLMYLLDDLGNDFIERLFKYYPYTDRDRLRRKLKFFQIADAVQLAIAGLNDRDSQKKNEGIAIVKSLLLTY
jgi:aminoglycoside 2''-phosphotransferase